MRAMTRRVIGATLVCVLSGVTADAQQPADISGPAEDLLYRLVVPAGPETASFLVQLIGQQLATFPVGSSSGSFSDVVNESDPLSMPRRAGATHGPLFAERTLTLGRPWKTAAGVSLQYSGFSRLADWPVEEVPLRTASGPGYDSAALLDLRVGATIATAFVNVAVTRNFDVGVTVPVMRVRVRGSVRERFNSSITTLASGEADASGVGDIAIRAKFRPGRATAGERGPALSADVRFPTGSARDLLGAGRARVSGTAIYTTEFGTVAPHVNVGYTRWVGDRQAAALTVDPVDHGINYAFGASWRAASRITVAGDVIGRHLIGGGWLDWRDIVTGSESVRVLAPQSGGSYLTLASAGIKVALGGNWLGVAHLTRSLRTNGLRPATGFAIGVERELD